MSDPDHLTPADPKELAFPVSSRFDEYVARQVRQRLAARFGDEDGLADLDAPAIHPHAENGMQDMALQHGAVALPQADGMLAPVRPQSGG